MPSFKYISTSPITSEYVADEEDVKEIIEQSEPPPKAPSKELLPVSASEMEQQILSSSLIEIAKGQERYLHEQTQREIREHYEKRAKKLLRKIWRECKKRTKHSDRIPAGNGFQRKTCGVLLHRDIDNVIVVTKGAATVAISEVARKLRAADVEAGIEWIP